MPLSTPLPQTHPDLALLVQQAEEIVDQAPDLALVRMRQFAEQAVVVILERVGRPSTGSLADCIARVHGSRAHHVRSELDTLRRLGNLAAHGGGATLQDVNSALRAAHHVSCWLTGIPFRPWPGRRKRPAPRPVGPAPEALPEDHVSSVSTGSSAAPLPPPEPDRGLSFSERARLAQARSSRERRSLASVPWTVPAVEEGPSFANAMWLGEAGVLAHWLSPNLRLAVVLHEDEVLRCWDLVEGVLRWEQRVLGNLSPNWRERWPGRLRVSHDLGVVVHLVHRWDVDDLQAFSLHDGRPVGRIEWSAGGDEDEGLFDEDGLFGESWGRAPAQADARWRWGPDADTLTTLVGGHLEVWSLSRGARAARVPLLRGVHTACVSPDGSVLVGFDAQALLLMDPLRGSVLQRHVLSHVEVPGFPELARDAEVTVNGSLPWSVDGRLLFAGTTGEGWILRTWSRREGMRRFEDRLRLPDESSGFFFHPPELSGELSWWGEGFASSTADKVYFVGLDGRRRHVFGPGRRKVKYDLGASVEELTVYGGAASQGGLAVLAGMQSRINESPRGLALTWSADAPEGGLRTRWWSHWADWDAPKEWYDL